MKSLKKNTQKEKQEQKNKKGISLIVLVVTIVVIIILVATVLYNITDGKLFGVANESVFKNDLRVIEEEFEMFVQTKATQSVGKFEIESLNAADNGLTYNTKTNDKETNIYDVIPTAKKGYYSEFEIIKGELYYKGKEEKKLIWAKEIDIGIIPYEIVDGVLISANSNLLLLDSTGTVRIPYNVTKIDSGVFNNLEGLRRVIIPGSVKEIGKNAFSNNTSLQEVIIEEGVEIIGDSAFERCSNLRKIQIPNSLKNIYNAAFRSCSLLENINLPYNLQYIGSSAFLACNELKRITIPPSITKISGNLFYGCINLQEITFLGNINSISTGAFNFCYNLEKINIQYSNYYTMMNDKLLTSDLKTLIFIIKNNNINIDSLTIDEGITNISNGALSVFYSNLKELNLPSTINDISKGIFESIPNIKTVNINNENIKYESDGINIYEKTNSKLILSISKEETVTIKSGTKVIGDMAFMFCKNLKNINLNEGLESIGNQAFSSTKIKKLYIPQSVRYIDPLAMYGLNLDKLEINENNSYYKADDNFLYTKDGKEIVVYLGNNENISIPEQIEIIGNYAFHSKDLKNIIISKNVKKIGQSFNHCKNLKNILIPNNIETIGNNCFQYCDNLTQINVDNKKDSISGAPWGSPYGMRVVNWLK